MATLKRVLGVIEVDIAIAYNVRIVVGDVHIGIVHRHGRREREETRLESGR